MTAMRPPEPQTTFTGREWAFRRVGKWLAGSGSCLVVTGRTGAGKTAFAWQLAAMARGEIAPAAGCERPGLHAVHRCEQQEFGSIDPIQVIERLAGELVRSVPGYAEALAEPGLTEPRISFSQTVHRAEPGSSVTLIKNLSLGERNPRRAWDRIIRRPLEVLERKGEFPGDIVILIDGLDEAVEGFAGFDLARLLSEERSPAVPHLRLLITTRPGQAADRLRDLAPSSFDLTDDQPRGVDDIESYTRQLIGDHPRQVMEIARGSEGSFLYAVHVVVEYLASGRFTGEELPPGLAAFYRAFLNRHIGADRASWRSAYRPVLGIIAESQGAGLSRKQIITAVGGRAMLPGGLTVDDVIYDCYPHLQGDLPDGPFCVGHRSFRDYLRAPGDHHIHPAEANNEIVTALVKEISREGIPDWSVADAYTRLHLLAHAMAAGRPDEFLGDLEFLLRVDATALEAALGQTSSPVSRRAADLCGRSPQRLPAYAVERRAILHLNAMAHGLEHEAAKLLARMPPGSLSHALRWVSNNGEYNSPDGTGWVSVNGRPHAVAGDAAALVLYDLETGKPGPSQELMDGVGHIAVRSPDLIAVSGGYLSVEVFDANLALIDRIYPHGGYASGLDLGAVGDRAFLLSTGNDCFEFHGDPGNVASFQIHEVQRGSDVRISTVAGERLNRIPGAVHCLPLNDATVGAFAYGTEVHLRTVPNGEPYGPPIKVGDHISSLYALDISGTGVLLAIGLKDSETLVLKIPERRVVFKTDTQTGSDHVLLIPSEQHGFLLFADARDGRLRVFAPTTPTFRREFRFPSLIRGLAQGPSGELIITTGDHVAAVSPATWLTL